LEWSGGRCENKDRVEIGRGGASGTDRDSLGLQIGHGAVPVGFGAISNDGELAWAVDASIEASRKALDVDGRGKYGTDKATCVNLYVTLQVKPISTVQGAFRPPDWAVEMDMDRSG
jgi:hypothetical protein